MGIYNKKSAKYFEIIFISIFWVLLYLAPVVFHRINNPTINWEFIFGIWMDYLPLFLIFCINRLVLIRFILFKSKPLLYILSVFALITITVITTEQFSKPKDRLPNGYGLLRFSQPDQMVRTDRQRPPMSAYPSYVNLVLLSFLLIGFDTGTKLSVRWARAEGQKAELEKENVKNELAFLRNQISPHFLMNTLNNIHSLIDFDTKEAKASIGKLSVLMRHLLYESDDRQTALSKEIAFIDSYIKLMKLRFSDDVDIKFETPAHIPDISIPPLLFTNVLENAFKYGISYNDKSFVHIRLNCSETDLEFIVENSIHKKNIDTGSEGIGIKNTQKRLQLLYQENYNYTYSVTNKVFRTIIKITI